MEEKRNMMNECYSCVHRQEVAGDAHISCDKPDPRMEGRGHGIKNGWFYYPRLFDPVWKTKDCANYENIELGQSSNKSYNATNVTNTH